MKRIDLALIRRWGDLIATTNDRETEPGYLDTIDGETNALDIADHLIAEIQHDAALVAALKAQEEAMSQRRARLENREKAKRRVAVELLEALGQRTSTMSKRTFSDLVELIYAFGAERGVRWSKAERTA